MRRDLTLAFLGDLNASHTHAFLPGIRDRLAMEDGVPTRFLALQGDRIPKSLPKTILESDAVVLISGQTAAWVRQFPLLSDKIYELGSGYPEAGFPGVDMDHERVGILAAHHLRERGYGRFAAFGTKDTWSKKRLEAFARTLASYGKPVVTEIFPGSEISFNWSRGLSKGVAAWIRHVNAEDKTPLGIFAVSDNPASSVLQWANQFNIPIPLNLGILGVNDDPMSGIGSGGKLSSIRLPHQRAGWKIVDLVLSGKKRREVLAPIDVVVRASTGGFLTEDPLVRRAQEWILRLPGKRIQVELLSASLGVTRMTLNRRFRAAFGKSFQTYLQEQRLGLARRALSEGGHTVESAARMAGWSATRSFIQAHRKVFGRTPGKEMLGS